ncbi:MAG: hypothetical protein ACREX6_02640, partial [Casimicrobiaceae bacterium]
SSDGHRDLSLSRPVMEPVEDRDRICYSVPHPLNRLRLRHIHRMIASIRTAMTGDVDVEPMLARMAQERHSA